MALTTIREIQERITDERIDNLVMLADDLVPIYYNELVEEWIELPIENRDSWDLSQVNDNTSITDLMAIDLFNYYLSTVELANDELQRERV